MNESWRTAIAATLHCLTGCAIGEVLGMVLATWWGWGDVASVVLAVGLAFFFGYLLTFVGVRRAGLWRTRCSGSRWVPHLRWRSWSRCR